MPRYEDPFQPPGQSAARIIDEADASRVKEFGATEPENATDSAMIIDAMDLLYTGNFRGFCLVSSDSDFTKLASRIRESALQTQKLFIFVIRDRNRLDQGSFFESSL